MKRTNLVYWITTGLLCALMLFSAIGGLVPNAQSTAMMEHIGFGPKVLPFLSVLKILGVIALLIPGFPRVKEWTYAGFTFDLVGAIYFFIAAGDPVSNWAFLLIGIVLIALSYIYWHKKYKLRNVAI